MHRSTKSGLIAIAILICVAAIILLINLDNLNPSVVEECVNLNGDETCHSTDPNPYRYFGTKTAYHVALESVNQSDIDVGECVPRVFYLLSRHATRYPDKEYIVDLIKKLPELRDRIINSSIDGSVKICSEDIEKLRNWSEKMKIKQDNKLSPTGEAEAKELARRLKKRFPSLLNQDYSPDKFVFEYTSRKRTKSTAEVFARGLFPNKPKIDFEENTNDEVLQFNKDCKKLQENCGNVTTYDMSEVENFGNGPLMQNVIESISQRVGFPITPDELKLIYLSCAFGYALEMSEAWCALFSSEELKVLEYDADIDDYYKDAYGNEINSEQACPVAKYIIDLFKSYESTNASKAVLHFSHAGAIKKVYTMFGLFQDNDRLTADSFCEKKDRKWRSSLIVPFNSNIIFILYECGDSYKIAAYHNEKIVHIEGCDNYLCPLEQFYTSYTGVADTCDINRICGTCRI